MVKNAESTKDLQLRAAGALRDFMAGVPAVRSEDVAVEPSLPGRGIDILAQLNLYDRPHSLICEVKSGGQPRNVPEALCVVFPNRVVGAFPAHRHAVFLR